MKKLAPLLLLALPGLAFAGARVSTMKVDQKLGKNFYNGAAAIDGKLDTAWVVPGESENKGEWIEIEIPKGDVDKIVIFPGFGKSDEVYKDYARIKQVRADVYAIDDDHNEKLVGSATIDVPDKAELQTFDIPDVKVGEGLFGGKVKMTVTDIYEGDDYPNLAVSELTILLKEFEPPKVPKITAIGGEDAGHEQGMMLDNNAKTFWSVDPASATFTLSGGSYGLSSIGFQSAGPTQARPKTVEVSVGNLTKTTVLPDATGLQWAPTPAFNGYNGGAFGDVNVKVVDTYPGTNPQLGVTELKVMASNAEAM